MSKKLSGKVAVVAAGAKNLGGQISRDLGAEGASVLVHFHGDAAQADAEGTVREITALGGRASIFQADLTQVGEVRRLFKAALDRYGRVDIAVNTVGKVMKGPVTEVTEEAFDQMAAVNTKAAFFFIQEAGLRLSDGGRIVSITTSLLGAFTGWYSLYAGAKAPVEQYTRAAAKEFGARGITVNTVAPGPLDTEFLHGSETPEAVAYLASASVSGRLGSVDDVVPAVNFLITNGGWITGQTLFVNGGFATR